MTRRRDMMLVLFGVCAMSLVGADGTAHLRRETGATGQLVTQAPVVATEQEWIVRDVLATILAVTSIGPGSRVAALPQIIVKAGPPSGNPFLDATFTVTVGSQQPQRIAVVNHVWAPAGYLEFARAHRPSASAGEAPASRSSALVAALTSPTTEVLLTQDRIVSEALTRTPASAAAHEDAALLVATFALRENAGSMFSDFRPALSRITAHLAIATALRGAGPRSPSGVIAEIALTTLVGNQRDALTQVAAWKKRALSPPEFAWASALQLRITGDWRARTAPARATLLEQLAYGRVLRSHLGDARYLEFIDQSGVPDVPDWHRIGVASGGFAVESGHRFVESGLEEELAEARRVRSSFHAGDFRLTDLNALPVPGGVEIHNGLPVVHVLDWGMWAWFLQRHLASQLISFASYFKSYGDPQSARALGDKVQREFGGLAVSSLVLRVVARDEPTYHRAMAAAAALVRSQPYRISARAWKTLQDKPDVVAKADAMASEVEWFTPFVPAGTAFDLANRALRENCERPAPLADVERWARMSPYDEWVIWNVIWRRVPGEPSIAEARKAYGPLLDYHIRPLTRMYRDLKGSNDDYIRIAESMCALDADRCGDFATTLVIAGREADAVKAYERWITRARDRIGVSNGLTWIVRYYYDTGRRERAMELGRLCEDVYSWAGLETWGELQDRMSKSAEAEQTFKALAERYENGTGPLGTFYIRQARRTRDTALETKGIMLLARVFPKGLERIPADALPAPPTDGMSLRLAGARATRFGLRQGDIVAMVDGVRVHNMAQYQVVSRLTFDRRMVLIVWRNGRYHRIEATVPQRWLGATLGNYQTPNPR